MSKHSIELLLYKDGEVEEELVMVPNDNAHNKYIIERALSFIRFNYTTISDTIVIDAKVDIKEIVIAIGKHEGKSIADIIEEDPQYIIYLVEEVEEKNRPEISDSEYLKAIKKVDE